MKLHFLKNRKGTALIVALLVMGVLMAISLALSALVLRESVVTREFLDAGQAYYAAESASEIGLYGVKNNLPGWEPENPVEIKIDEGYGSVAQLLVRNKCKAYPCFDDGYDRASAEDNPEAFYTSLGLNESATIPLFVVGDDGEPTAITGFRVQFYANFTKSDLKIQNNYNLSDWDVLRWKIVGLKEVEDKSVTESISDFTAVSFLNDPAQSKSSAEKPSWFGTDKCNIVKPIEGLYSNQIECIDYTLPSTPPDGLAPCGVTEAREFYLYNGLTKGDRNIEVSYCYPLNQFIADHKLNYLTLTNLINPSVFMSSIDDAKTKLYYRIELFTDKNSVKTATNAVREYADITADGYSGKSKQSVNVKIKRDSFMPVFNFSLYSTYRENRMDANGNDITDSYWDGP